MGDIAWILAVLKDKIQYGLHGCNMKKQSTCLVRSITEMP